LKSKLKIKRKDALLLAVFYVVVGVAHIIILYFTNFGLLTSGVLGVLSFMAAYGLFKARKWVVWLVVMLFFPQLAFCVSSLTATVIWYEFLPELNVLLLNISLAVFTALSFISFAYVAAKRKTFH